MTTKNQKAEAENKNNGDKPVGHAYIPVRNEKGKERWIEAGPIWAQKNGEGQVLEIQSLPVYFFTNGIPASFRLLLQPAKDA